MRRIEALGIAMVLGALLGCAKERQVPPPDEAPAPGTPAWKVAEALSAGPDWLAGLATVAEWPLVDTAQFAIVRPGTGGWTCFPDLPLSPRPDPLCADDRFLQWITLWRARGAAPALGAMGVAYVYRGMQVASAADPLKIRPDSGKAWVDLPPAVLIAMPSPAAERGLPAKPSTEGPWVLWAGTPWALVVVPVGLLAPAPHGAATPADSAGTAARPSGR